MTSPRLIPISISKAIRQRSSSGRAENILRRDSIIYHHRSGRFLRAVCRGHWLLSFRRRIRGFHNEVVRVQGAEGFGKPLHGIGFILYDSFHLGILLLWFYFGLCSFIADCVSVGANVHRQQSVLIRESRGRLSL